MLIFTLVFCSSDKILKLWSNQITLSKDGGVCFACTSPAVINMYLMCNALIVQIFSGGNKRKLSTAIALVGDPPIVFLVRPFRAAA